MKRAYNPQTVEEKTMDSEKVQEQLERRVKVVFDGYVVKVDYLFAADITFNIYNVFFRLPVYAGGSPEQLYNHCESYTIVTANEVDLRLVVVDRRELIANGDTLRIEHVPQAQKFKQKVEFFDGSSFYNQDSYQNDHDMLQQSTAEATKLT